MCPSCALVNASTGNGGNNCFIFIGFWNRIPVIDIFKRRFIILPQSGSYTDDLHLPQRVLILQRSDSNGKPFPQVQFTSSASSGCSPVDVSALQIPTQAVLLFIPRNFGDGSSTSSDYTDTYLYFCRSVFGFIIVTQDPSRYAVDPKYDYCPASPIADFTASNFVLGIRFASPIKACLMWTVINGYSWNFGDGKSPIISGYCSLLLLLQALTSYSLLLRAPI